MHYKKYREELLRHVKNVEEKNKDYFSCICDEIFSNDKHNMFIGKEKLLKNSFDNFSDLEKADLIDFENMEHDGGN